MLRKCPGGPSDPRQRLMTQSLTPDGIKEANSSSIPPLNQKMNSPPQIFRPAQFQRMKQQDAVIQPSGFLLFVQS